MNEKEFTNDFKFQVTQGDVILCECLINADSFTPFTRYSINIRDMLPSFITSLQKILSRKSYLTTYDCYDEMIYDFNEYRQECINKYPIKFKHLMRYSPFSVVQKIEDMTIKGVECKMGFYINNKPIVERTFYVDGFNPIVRSSVEIVNVSIEITEKIKQRIIETDINNIWDDYDLINKCGLKMIEIRELAPERRKFLLSSIKR